MVVTDFVAVLNEGTILPGEDAKWDDEALGKDARGVWAGTVGIVKDEGLIRSAFCEEGFCGVPALVGIDGIFARGGGPHAARGIPDDGDGFADSLFFTGDKLRP